MENMFHRYRCLSLIFLVLCQHSNGISVITATKEQPDLKVSVITAKEQRDMKIERIRDVEAIDPGLLANGTEGANLEHQFSNNYPERPFGVANKFGPDQQQGSSFPRPGSSFNPGISGSFNPNQGGVGGGFNGVGVTGNGGGFLPGGQSSGGFNPGNSAGGFIPGGQSAGGFNPGNSISPVFPGQGIVPGSTNNLPPGSVSADTVAFSVAKASEYTRTDVTQVRFDNTITDVGYGWYPDRSEFVCYYPGLYFFTFSGLSTQTRQFKLTLVQNNQEIISAWSDQSGYQTGTNSAVLTLNQGDRVYLVLQEGSLHEATTTGKAGYTTFSGFRIR